MRKEIIKEYQTLSQVGKIMPLTAKKQLLLAPAMKLVVLLVGGRPF